jgi:hypothetical protein
VADGRPVWPYEQVAVVRSAVVNRNLTFFSIPSNLRAQAYQEREWPFRCITEQGRSSIVSRANFSGVQESRHCSRTASAYCAAFGKRQDWARLNLTSADSLGSGFPICLTHGSERFHASDSEMGITHLTPAPRGQRVTKMPEGWIRPDQESEPIEDRRSKSPQPSKRGEDLQTPAPHETT